MLTKPTALTTPRRSRLESLVADATCAILSAPAGFGKTATVSNALAQARGASSGQVVWVELGTAFRTDATTAGRGFAAALGRLGVNAEVFESAPPFESFDAETADRILVALEAIDGHATLVLDDFHRVGAPLAAQLARILRSWIDDRRQVIVCTQMGRSELAALWPLHDASFIAGPDELKFHADEIADMLGAELESYVETVAEATGGWPRAVETVRRNLQVDPATGFDTAISELESMVLAEVIPVHQPDDLDVLTAVSVCERFTPGVADRASHHAGGALRLQRLARDSGLVRFDGSMFSFVPVYRHALVRHLAVTDPGALRSTYARIAEAWLDEPDSIHATVHSIAHLIDAGEFDRAMGLIKRRWEQMYTASNLDRTVELIDRLPMRYWADDAGSALLAGWANVQMGRAARALEMLQSHPLRTPVGAAVTRLVWAHGVFWTTGPAEALELVAEGRRQLEAFDDETTFPAMPGADNAATFRNVADAAETNATFLLGDLAGSIELLDDQIKHPTQHRPISMAGLHAVAALVRAFRGDRPEAIEHLRAGSAIARQLRAEPHYVMVPADLATAVLAVWDGDDVVVQRALQAAVDGASAVGAAHLLRVCELVADLAGHRFHVPDESMLERAAKLPFVDSQLAVRAARRLVDLGDHEKAASTIDGVQPNELALSSWVHVLLDRYTNAEVRTLLSAQPGPSCAHGQVVRFLAEATVADDPATTAGLVRRAVDIASDRRLVGVIADAPAAIWEREEVRRLDLALLNDARRRLRDGVQLAHGFRFSAREIELLRLMARSATAVEIAERLYLSVNTVKWHKANIYRKLGVSGGRAAIERASELGMVPKDDLVD